MPLLDSSLISFNPGLMIWTLVTFLIVLFVLRRYAFGPIQQVIDERRRAIQQGLDEAERAREEIEAETRQALGEVKKQLADLTVAATEKVVRRKLDEAEQRRLIEEA